MKKMKTWTILLLSLVLTCTFVLTGCGTNESNNPKAQKISEEKNKTTNEDNMEGVADVDSKQPEKESAQVEQEQQNSTTTNKEHTTTSTDKKTSNKSSSNTTTTNEKGTSETPNSTKKETSGVQQTQSTQGSSANTSTNNTTTNTQTHTHNWIAQTKTINHEATGHYETKVVEEVYAWRTFCNKCGEDITDLGVEGITIHSAVLCESGYHNDYVVIETKTDQVWVVDTPASTETVITGYKCSCGATK